MSETLLAFDVRDFTIRLRLIGYYLSRADTQSTSVYKTPTEHVADKAKGTIMPPRDHTKGT
jgi:hypothetical protein